MSSPPALKNLRAKQDEVLIVLDATRQWLTPQDFRTYYPGKGGLDPGKRLRELRDKGLVKSRPRPNSGGQVEFRFVTHQRTKPKRVRPRRGVSV